MTFTITAENTISAHASLKQAEAVEGAETSATKPAWRSSPVTGPSPGW